MGFTTGLCFRNIANSIFNTFSFYLFFLIVQFCSCLFLYSLIFLSLFSLPLHFCHVFVTQFVLDSVQACQKSLLLKFLAVFILGTMLCSILMDFWGGLPACVLDHYIFVYSLNRSLLAFMTKLSWPI